MYCSIHKYSSGFLSGRNLTVEIWSSDILRRPQYWKKNPLFWRYYLNNFFLKSVRFFQILWLSHNIWTLQSCWYNDLAPDFTQKGDIRSHYVTQHQTMMSQARFLTIPCNSGCKELSMTQLLSHTFAHLTGPSFRLKAKLLPNKKFLGLM